RRPVLAAIAAGANEVALVQMAEGHFVIVRNGTRCTIDFRDDVLKHGRTRPEELAGFAIQGVDDTCLAGYPRQDFAAFAGLDLRIDPENIPRIRRDCRIDKQALERMIEVPMIDDMLIIPDDLSRIRIQGKRRIVVEMFVFVAAKYKLRSGNGNGSSDIDQIQ